MTKTRMTVYDVAPEILGSFDVGLREYAAKKFMRKGIRIKTKRRVLEVNETTLVIEGEQEAVPYGYVVVGEKRGC